jgi:hypothetical protein
MSSDLNSLLSEYSRQPLPPVTGPSTAEIWRAIEHRRTESLGSRLSDFFDLTNLLPDRRLVIAALTYAAVVGVIPAALIGRAENERRLARQSIHLEVFALNTNSFGAKLNSPKATEESRSR